MIGVLTAAESMLVASLLLQTTALFQGIAPLLMNILPTAAASGSKTAKSRTVTFRKMSSLLANKMPVVAAFG